MKIGEKLSIKNYIFKLLNGESANLDNIEGLLVIYHGYSRAIPCICQINSYTKSLTHISGREISNFPMTIEWVGDAGMDYKMKITSTYTVSGKPSQTSDFQFCFLGYVRQE